MGCPDWPKCFGLLVPPTSVEEIPPAFFEKHPQFQAQSFNAFQTWVEYVNRLVGATIGLLMFATAALSLGFWRRDRRIVGLSVLAMLLTGFEGWLGKLVVDRNLAGGMVTIHMLVAMVIMALLILANYLVAARRAAQAPAQAGSGQLVWLGALVLALTLAQVLIGTQVREGVDEMAAHLGPMKRSGWLAPSLMYTLHKGLWMVLVGGLVVWLLRVWQALSANRTVRLLVLGLVAAVVSEVIFGMALAYQDLPPTIQPLHMLFANLIFAAEFAIWIHVLGMQRLASKQLKNNMLPMEPGLNAE
jgi:cytochrome c oxidase assembly protein subunit 15